MTKLKSRAAKKLTTRASCLAFRHVVLRIKLTPVSLHLGSYMKTANNGRAALAYGIECKLSDFVSLGHER